MGVQRNRQSTWLAGRTFLDLIRWHLTHLESLILLGILITLFFMPLHEKLKAAGFWITLALWLTKLVRERHAQKIWIPPLGWALLLFVGVAFLSAIFSDYHNRATRGALDALRNTLFFLVLVNTVNSHEKIRWIIFALMGGMVFGDFAGIYKYFSIGPELEMLSLGEKNSTAQVLSFFLALLLGILFTQRRQVIFRTGILIVIGLTGFTLVLTYARGIWISLLVALIAFWIVRLDWKVPAALSLLFGMVLLGMSFSDRFAEKIVSLENPLIAPNMIGRYEIWKQSLEIVKDRPLLGIGLKTYGLPQVTQKYQLESSSHAHNMFLNVAAELGLAGLIALTVWLIFYFKTILRMYPGMRSELNQGLWLGGLGCFVVLMVGGITHSMLGSESSLMLMTVLGLMFAGFRVESKESHLISRYLYKLAGCARTGHQSAAAVR